MSRLPYHQIVTYTRMLVPKPPREDGIEVMEYTTVLIPRRVTWFHDGVKFIPLSTPTTFKFLFSGHAQWVADQINPRPPVSESQYNAMRRAA